MPELDPTEDPALAALEDAADEIERQHPLSPEGIVWGEADEAYVDHRSCAAAFSGNPLAVTLIEVSKAPRGGTLTYNHSGAGKEEDTSEKTSS